MIKLKRFTAEEMSRSNIIAVNIEKQKRSYTQTIGADLTKTINRTKYLKVCWFCGQPYESNKYNTYSCSPRCTQNIIYAMKRGLNPPAKMDFIMKEKNVKEIKEKFNYK